MADYDDLVQALIHLLTQRLEPKFEFTRGLLGDGNGNIDIEGRDGFSFVRPNRGDNKVVELFNKNAFAADGTPVLIGELPWQPGLQQVLGIDWDTYLTVGWENRVAGIAQHGDMHTWRDGFIGEDPFTVYRRQIFDLRTEVVGSGSTSVTVTPYGINDRGVFKTWPGSPEIDLAGAIPSTTGTVRNVLVYWNFSGTSPYGSLGIVTGTLSVVSDTIIPPKPTEPKGTIPSSYVKLQGGQSQVTEADLTEARPIFTPAFPHIIDDGVKVSKVYESDFENAALQSDADGDITIGTTAAPGAKVHIDQADDEGAKPPLLLDQADVSEEMLELVTTIGTGNAIEASALKVLTTTHFVKTTIPGGLTRYSPLGTISNTAGPILYKSQTVTTQGLGANPDIFAFGFYEWSISDANLNQGSTTQTLGTANISYAAHAFAVTGGAGLTDAGVVGLRVNGVSINDQGTRTPGDTETIIADITAVALDDYQESAKKWLGQVTYELFTVSGSPTTFSLDFNYGFAKYDDWGNNDFTITDVEAIGFAGANDTNFDIKLMHHRSSGWAYSAAAFTPITAANTIASLATDHSTDDQLASSQHSAWKRDNLSTVINGADSEGFLIFISSTANNAIEYLNLHIGVVF